MSRGALNMLLGALVFGSALALVWARHESRVSFVEMQSLTAKRDALNTEWGRLQLEQATWAEESRIERIAREKLDMHSPGPDETRVIVR